MDSESLIVLCSQCGTKNRIPKERWGERAVCGKCQAPLPFYRFSPAHSCGLFSRSFALARGSI